MAPERDEELLEALHGDELRAQNAKTNHMLRASGAIQKEVPQQARRRSTPLEIEAPAVRERDRFPMEALPNTIREFCVEASISLQAEPDMLALFALGHLSGAIGFTRRLLLKEDWKPPANLWIAVIADPGMLKTPSLTATARPLNAFQQRLFDEYDRDYAQYEAVLAAWERATPSSRDKRPTAPIPRQIVIRDITVEAATTLLWKNRRGLMFSLDELSGWIQSFGEYKGGGGHDRSFWLSSWSVDTPSTTNRQRDNGRALHVPNPCIAICGGLQPSKLPAIRNSQADDDGMMDRFLFGFPGSIQRHWTNEIISPVTRASYDRTIYHLLDFRMDGADDEGRESPRIVTMQAGAHDAFSTMYDLHHRRSQEADFDPQMQGAWSKFDEQAARLALVLFCTKVAEGTLDFAEGVDVESVIQAWMIIEYFEDGARRARDLLATDEIASQVERVINYMKKRDMVSITLREMVSAKLVSEATLGRALMFRMRDRGFGDVDEEMAGSRLRCTFTLANRLDPKGLHEKS